MAIHTDEAWLDHLMNLNEWLENNNIDNLLSNANKDVVNIKAMPPLAQWVAWLIVTHHRLPPIKKVFYPYKDIQRLQLPQNTLEIKRDLNQFYGKIQAFRLLGKKP